MVRNRGEQALPGNGGDERLLAATETTGAAAQPAAMATDRGDQT